MLLVAFGYRELNRAMPDSGTSFTWATRAFGPWIGWMAGWGLIAATILVLSNLAGVAVEFLFLLIAQIAGNPGHVAELAFNPFINVGVCLLFMLGATFDLLSRHADHAEAAVLPGRLPGAGAGDLLGRRVRRTSRQGNAFDASPVELAWFNPFAVGDFGAVVAGLSLSIFIFWGWDVTLTMNEETKDPEKTPGRAATLTVADHRRAVPPDRGLAAHRSRASARGARPRQRGHPGRTCSSTCPGRSWGRSPCWSRSRCSRAPRHPSSRRSSSPARTLLAMGHYGALPPKFAEVSPRFFTPGYATIVSAIVASVFYAVMRFISEDVLWDTITTLGMMICFYYGLTAFACVWYFRKQWFDSTRNVFFTFLFPLIGGVILAFLFVHDAHRQHGSRLRQRLATSAASAWCSSSAWWSSASVSSS